MHNLRAREKKLKFKDGDANAMMKYFEMMQTNNKNFFHMQRLDKHGVLQDVLWLDARSRAAYEDFGDVVCFDTTFLLNKYDLPFANFVGVNHHGQTILLGCALISRENTETFKLGDLLLCFNFDFCNCISFRCNICLRYLSGFVVY